MADQVVPQTMLDSDSTPVARVPVEITPPGWEAQKEDVQIFDVKKGEEWDHVEMKIKATCPRVTISKIIRIQNLWLWKRYDAHKRMVRENNRSVNEKELFHGTRANDPALIYEEGFDMRLSAGGKWGRANYFTVSAGYADRFAHRTADGCKEIFLVKVATGNSCYMQPNSRIRRPPRLTSSTRYDTITGIVGGARSYMTYDNDKAYPAYLIKYSM